MDDPGRGGAGDRSAFGAWVRKHLVGYTGMLNLETIGGTIIEVHLRLADQWPDLYGSGWVDAVVRLYETGIWDFADSNRRGGYSAVLFGRNGGRNTKSLVNLSAPPGELSNS